jgi:hypothetical protein
VSHKLSQRLMLVGDIFRGRPQVAFDLVQIPLKRRAVHPSALQDRSAGAAYPSEGASGRLSGRR